MSIALREHRWLLTAAIAVAVLYSVVHVAVSGVLQPLRSDNVGQVIEELQPLYRLFTLGVASVDQPRQYGPVFLLVFHPVYQYTLNRPDLLAWYAYALDVVATIVAFLATRRAIAVWMASRGLSSPRWLTPALLFLWANFSPLFGVLAVKNVELWELALIAVAGSALLEQRRWVAAWAIAAAALIKMLPFVFLPYLLLRERRTFVYTVIALAAILTLSNALYGSQMGWGYLPMILQAAAGGEGYGNAAGMIWHENISIRGVAFKLFGYLEPPQPSSLKPYQVGYYVVVPESLRLAAVITAWTAQLAAAAWLLFRFFKHRKVAFVDRVYWEWALVAIMMLVLAPQISQDYMVLTLGAFSYVLAGCLLRNDRALWVQFAVALVLVGNVLPRSMFGRLLQLHDSMRIAGTDHLLPAEAYQYLGFPLLGLIVLLRVWSQLASDPARST